MQNKRYTVECMIKLDDNKIFIRFQFNGRVFVIEFGPEDLFDPGNTPDAQPLKQQYLDALHHLFGEDGSEEAAEATECPELPSHFHPEVSPTPSITSSDCGCEEDPLIAFTVAPFLAYGIFDNFAPESSTPCLKTLQDVLHPPRWSFGLHIVDGNLVPINRSPDHIGTLNPLWASFSESQLSLGHPLVEAKDVKLAQAAHASPNTSLVMFSNQLCWFKPVLTGVGDEPYIREVDILSKLSRESRSQTLRFPRLEAIVLDDKLASLGCINGLILSAIYPNRGTIAERVKGSEGLSLPSPLRERWCQDVENMIHLLHDRGLVWGDVSPNNMVTDEDDNVWIVDFGGGYTEGCIEPEDMETQKGDLEGLKRVKEYLLGEYWTENAADDTRA